MNEHTQTYASRRRPRSARAVHNLGDDLRWAISAWCDVPRPARRLTAGIVTAAAAAHLRRCRCCGLDHFCGGQLAGRPRPTA